MKKFIFIFITLFILLSKAYGLNLDKVNVFGENINECGLSNTSVTAALASVMRYNRIPMEKNHSGVNLYHQVTAIDLGNSCVAHINLSFYIYETKVFVPTFRKNISTDINLCNKSMLLTGAKYSMQGRLNDAAKNLTELCLVEIDKK